MATQVAFFLFILFEAFLARLPKSSVRLFNLDSEKYSVKFRMAGASIYAQRPMRFLIKNGANSCNRILRIEQGVLPASLRPMDIA